MSAKEMIDKIKKCLIAGYDLDIITQKEMDILWNYITNLQTIEQQYSAILSENAELENKITNLQEENKRLNNQYDLMENSLDEKQEVIDKTIEYIKDFWKKKSYYEDIDNCMKYATMNEFDKEDLLNILEGSDKK